MKKFKAIIVVLAKVGLTLAAFYILSKRITLNPLTYLTKDSYHYFLLALFVGLMLIFMQALRWKNIAQISSITLSYKKCLVAVWAGHLVNNLLPTATAGDLLRSYTLHYVDEQKRKWKWLGAFIFEKYVAATSTLLIASIVLITSISKQLPIMLMVFIVLLFAVLIFLPIVIRQLMTFIDHSRSKFLHYVQRINAILLTALLNKNGRKAFIDSFLINLAMCLMFYIIALGLDAPIGLLECLFVVPVFTVLASLPISYAGWGVRELSCVALLQFFGVPTETAVMVSIFYGLTVLASCLPGIFLVYSFFPMKKQMAVNVSLHS